MPHLARAQWVTESYPLKEGWNAIWLSHDCSVDGDGGIRTIETALAGKTEILEVWRWNPLGASVQFTQSPSAPIASDTSWHVWTRDDNTGQSTLGTLTGNSAYLIRVKSGTLGFALELIGKPLVPNYSFSSSGLNFIGFPISPSDLTFESFFSSSAVLSEEPNSVFSYEDGGLLNDNPKKLNAPRLDTVSRGQAYWVNSNQYSDYYGPLKVTVLGFGGIDFGRKLNTVTVRVKNVTDPAKNQNVTATFTLVDSKTWPGPGSAASSVPLRVRGPRDANLQFTYTDLPATLIDLAPGEERDLILDANRTQMAIADQSYEAILQVTDSLGHTRIDLPVSAIGSSPNGIWVGAAVLDSVNRVETISGPETDAPVGTPNGAGPETVSVATTTVTTTAGQTSSEMSFDATFDAEGNVDLGSAALAAANVSVAKYVSGTLDESFNPGADNQVESLAIQSDGKIVVGGGFNGLGGQARHQIGRLNADGTLDDSFNPGANGWVNSLAIQSDGKILVGGNFTALGGQSRDKIGRLNADGTLDKSFNPGANISVDSLAIQSDGKILVGGNFTTLGGQPRSRIGRLNADGSVDETFNPGADSTVTNLALQPNGKILVGGNLTTLGVVTRNFLGRLNADGSVDATFNPDANNAVRAFAVQPDGKILVGGEFSELGGQAQGFIGRLNADGTLDESFNPGASSWVYSLAIQSDGKILVGGHFTALGGQARHKIGRLNADGTLDESFNPGANSLVFSFAIQPDDGKILVGGNFNEFGGQPRNYIGRLDTPYLVATDPVADYAIAPSMRGTVTNGGSGYTSPPNVTLTGGDGSGAEAYATLSARVRSVTIADSGSSYTSAPVVTFTGGGGSGATGFALIDPEDGIVTDVSMTNGGSGYTTAPSVTFTGDGSVAAATAEITGSVGRITISAEGSGYTAAPTVIFAPNDQPDGSEGEGSGAAASVQFKDGVVIGMDAVQRQSGGSIPENERVRITVTTESEAPAGTRDGSVTTTVTSTSKLVTLNGKSHTVTRRISTGGGAAAPSNFPIRLILHAPASGAPTLLQQVYLGTRDGVSYAGPEEASIHSLVTGTLLDIDENAGKLGRVSSASFPRGGFWTAEEGGGPDTASFIIDLFYDAPTNPFLHTYHPDHDNWDERYESKLLAGVESYQVSRKITLNFSQSLPAGVSDLTWGVTTLGGTYSEVLTGLRSEQIEVSGRFILHQVSEVEELELTP